ncbi:MAG: hypothetical protein JXM70_23515 [Pirellulales bacterium]|nr:hypothetical protein [Pirellulales bacterium]
MKKISIVLCLVASLTSTTATAQNHTPEQIKMANEMVDSLSIRVQRDANGNVVLLDTAANRSWVDDEQMQEILIFPKIASLTLEGPGITDALAPKIAKLQNLTMLALRNTLVGDKGVPQFVALKKLKIIDLRLSPLVSDKSMKTLATMPSLRAVRLVGANITDDGVDSLLTLPSLVELDIRNCAGVTRKSIEKMASKKTLRTLKVGGAALDDKSLQLIADMRNITALSIETSPVTDAGVAQLGKLPLKSLTLYQCPNLTDTGLKVLADHKELKQLTLRDLPAKGTALALLPHPEKLISLKMAQSRITDAEVAHLAKMTNLEQLDLGETAITDASVDMLAKLNSLKKLTVNQTGISERGMERLKKSLPDCQIR